MAEMMLSKDEKSAHVVRGQLHKFMLIPIIEDEARWFPAGPVTFGVEGRAFGTSDGVVKERGASVHVFSPDRKEEWLRFDCFDNTPHYHYILQADQHNVVWGYDPVANGEMISWAMMTLRARLAPMLRRSGADDIANVIDRDGFDAAVLDQVEKAMREARERTFPGADMIAGSIAWYNRWKTLHPEFNTVDD